MRRTIRRYPKELNQEAVTLALKSPSPINTAKELGIPPATLPTWINLLKNQGSLPNTSEGSRKDRATLMRENRRLQKECAIVKEEKERLKKAATYFAQHQQ